MDDVATLVYDGDCGFCTRSLQWGLRHLGHRPRVLDFRSTDPSSLGVRPDDAERALHWVAPDGAVSVGARAVGRWCWASGGVWRVPGALCLVPPASWVAAWMYRVVAANRHRMPGGTSTCTR